MFFTYAAAWRTGARSSTSSAACARRISSGYPDCRDDTLKALQVTLNLGMDARFVIETPLMWIDKRATWALADALGGQPFVDLIIEETHTCYLGARDVKHAWGYGCGTCPACELRARGYFAWAGE